MKYQTINAGDHFGRLETLERIKIGRRIAWICKCSCGNTRAVLSQNLNNGTTKSCGCYNREAASQRIREKNFKHGRTPRRLYEAWKNMRRRRKAGVDVEAIFMGAITWAIIGICYMIYSEF